MSRHAVLASLLFAAAASAQPRPAGEVVFHNNTSGPVKVVAHHIIDAAGRRTALEGTWEVRRGARLPLRLDGKLIVAHKFEFRLTTFDGTGSWESKATSDKSPLVAMMDDATLAKYPDNRIAGGERLPRPTGRVVVHNTTGERWTLTCRQYRDAKNTLRTPLWLKPWTVAKGETVTLDDGDRPMPVGRIELTLTTADGSSGWFVEAETAGADVPLLLGGRLLRRHREAIKVGRTDLLPAAEVPAAALEEARTRIAGLIDAARGEPSTLGEALTRGGAAARDRAILAELRAVLPGREAAELAAVRAVVLRVRGGELRPKKEDTVVEALSRAGVTDPEDAAAFVMGFAPR